MQRIEVGTGERPKSRSATATFPAGSYVIKRDQPYGRLAKNLLERQNYPDPNLTTYDDSGWTMGLAMLVEVKEIKDKAILDVRGDAGRKARRSRARSSRQRHGRPRGGALRLEQHDRVPLQAEGRADEDRREELHGRRRSNSRPARSSSLPPADLAAVAAGGRGVRPDRGALSARAERCRCTTPICRASRSTRRGTARRRSAGYRSRFDQFGIPFDLIYKERVKKGNLARRLRRDRDADAAGDARGGVRAAGRAAGALHRRATSTSSSAMYGESPDITGGMGGEGVDAFAKFLEGGGTLIATGDAVRFPTELGLARTVDASGRRRPASTRRGRSCNAEIVKPEHPVFYGYTEQDHPDQVPRRAADVRSATAGPGHRARALRRRRRRRAERPDARRRRDCASVRSRSTSPAATPARAASSCSRTTRSTAGRTTASSTWCSTRC